jgi:hypothetical protein
MELLRFLIRLRYAVRDQNPSIRLDNVAQCKESREEIQCLVFWGGKLSNLWIIQSNVVTNPNVASELQSCSAIILGLAWINVSAEVRKRRCLYRFFIVGISLQQKHTVLVFIAHFFGFNKVARAVLSDSMRQRSFITSWIAQSECIEHPRYLRQS